MWSIALSTVIVSLIGAMAHFTQPTERLEQRASVAAQVESMAIYRAAVVRYFSAHDDQRDTAVDLATLRAEGALRGWSTLADGQWNNYRTADGTIYIYGVKVPGADVGAALARYSHNSLMAGTYREATHALHTPSNDGDPVPLAALLARRTLVDGVPVWLAGAQ
ncbi:type IV pilus biogenesis protein PilM [Massilia sp. YMA4]|uniref:type IV pilus biogenesis protein PilM n=1 Tax=Massilia sp. YMA4 TaxID=1593482 RepID=UPI000DD13AA2|nr:type IV pilus biogenesis protein PilM [Massilia sp. YMA4]AXA93476.1 hypothetical protein DPH57_21395 [Massilia sp. YMA4]